MPQSARQRFVKQRIYVTIKRYKRKERREMSEKQAGKTEPSSQVIEHTQTSKRIEQIREKLDAYHSVEALAMQVTKNLSLDKIKLRKPQGSELESVTLVSDAVSPDEQLEQRDAAECIRHLIAQLPALQQTIIRMKDVEGYELAEIAEITATPVENVRVNLSRARKKIREQFLQLNKQEKWT